MDVMAHAMLLLPHFRDTWLLKIALGWFYYNWAYLEVSKVQ